MNSGQIKKNKKWPSDTIVMRSDGRNSHSVKVYVSFKIDCIQSDTKIDERVVP